MSAIVTQLSYNINEKLRLDDHAFPAFQPHLKSESQASPATKSTSFSPKEPCGQWMPSPTPGSSPFVTSATTPSSTSNISSDSRIYGASRSVVGVACQRFTHHRSLVFPRRDIKPVALVRTSTKDAETSQTTVYDLRDNAHKFPRKSLSTIPQQSKVDKSNFTKNVVKSTNINTDDQDLQSPCTSTETQQPDTFPTIIGRSCTLHSPKKSNGTATTMADVPPNKRHCRSVSEPDDLFDVSTPRLSHSASPALSSWKPGMQSRVWVPIKHLRNNSRRAYSANASSTRMLGDCSRSLDCGSLHSGSSLIGASLLTPPVSPVPRPASVTVIKQEGGAWTFLSSQHTLSGHYSQSSFSPLSSPCCNNASPSSSRSHDLGSRTWNHTGLSATKRSLSFSEDFEHRESIEYTPTSTPELERRFDQDLSRRRGGLLRCQSHPSDLNLRRSKGRRKINSRLCHHRPNLDFAKMKQTSFNKRHRCRDRSLSGPQNNYSSWSSLPSDLGQVPTVRPVFPSLIGSKSPLKKNTPKLQPVPSSSSSVTFTIGCSKPLSDIQRRIPSPTDEVPTEPDDMTVADGDAADVGTSSGGVVSSFVRDCDDLDINDIENETDDEMAT